MSKTKKIREYALAIGMLAGLAGCSSLNQSRQGSGVYYQPGKQASPTATNEASSNNNEAETGNRKSQSSEALEQKKQPKVVNPKSKSAYKRSQDQAANTSSGKASKSQASDDFEYYPEDRSESTSAYGAESDYHDYKYTNRIRRFESDFSFGYFDPFYYGPSFGYSNYYRYPLARNSGFSLGVSFGNRPSYLGYNRFGYGSYGGFYDPWNYRRGYHNGFYNSRLGFHDPYSRFNRSPLYGGYTGYSRFNSPYHHHTDFNSSGSNNNPKMKRPRNSLGSNFDTDNTPDRKSRQDRGNNIQRRQKQDKKQKAKENQNRQFDYYNPRQKRSKPEDRNRRTPRDRRDRSNPSTQERDRQFSKPSRDLDPRRAPNRSKDRNRNFNQQNNRDRSNIDQKRRRTPSRNNRNRGGNNNDNRSNRPRR